MTVVTDPVEIVRVLAEARRAGRRIALVPTLGALHRGHASLIEAASADNDIVCVSVFVNPLQFNDPTDFDRYDRDLDGDAELATTHGASLVFTPSVAAMLGNPPGVVVVEVGPIGEILEGTARPGHFRGVATIVTNLLALTWPANAYFGEKDYQQLVIVRSLVAGLSFPVGIVACPTVREPDGLALSSRNARLDPQSRAAAPTFYSALVEGRRTLLAGGKPADAEEAMATVIRTEPRIIIDYATCLDARTLGPPQDDGSPVRLLIAGWLGGVRLIDNLDPLPGAAPVAVEYPSSVPPIPSPPRP